MRRISPLSFRTLWQGYSRATSSRPQKGTEFLRDLALKAAELKELSTPQRGFIYACVLCHRGTSANFPTYLGADKAKKCITLCEGVGDGRQRYWLGGSDTFFRNPAGGDVHLLSR